MVSTNLTTHPLWTHLTKKQQAWAVEYLESHDAVEAAKKTHTVRTQRSAEAVAGRLLRNWKVRRVVGMMSSEPLPGVLLTKPEALQLLSDRLRDIKTDNLTFAKLIQTYVTLSGWVAKSRGNDSPKDRDPEPDDFDKVIALEQKRKHDGKD